MFYFLLLNILFTAAIIFLKISSLSDTIKPIVAISSSLILSSVLYFSSLTLNIQFWLLLIVWSFLNIVGFFSFLRKHKKINLSKFNVNNSHLFFLLALLYNTYKFTNSSLKWGRWDAWSIWNLHAKFLYYDNFWENLFTDKIAWSHSDYPLMLPSMIAMIWKSLGIITPIVPIIIGYLPFVGILILLFLSSKNFKNPYLCLLIVMLISIDSNFIIRASSQYADTFLAFFYLLTTILIIHVQNDGQKSQTLFFFIGLFAATGIWIKNEGVFFFIFTTLFLVVRYSRERRFLLQYGLGSIILLFTFCIFKLIYAPSNDLIAGQSINTLSKVLDFSRYITVLRCFGSRIIFKFPILLFMAFFILLTNPKKIFTTSFIIISLTLFAYLSTFIITPNELLWHLSNSLERLIHQLYPTYIFLTFMAVDKIISSRQTLPLVFGCKNNSS